MSLDSEFHKVRNNANIIPLMSMKTQTFVALLATQRMWINLKFLVNWQHKAFMLKETL